MENQSGKTNWKFSKNFATNLAALIIASLCLITLVGFGVRSVIIKRTITKSEQYLQKGYGALAAETLHPYRHSVVDFERGCQIMLASYFQSRRAEPLEWAAQACLEAGKDPASSFLAMAAAREFMGRDIEALQILTQAAQQFDQIAEIHLRLGEVHTHMKNLPRANEEYLKALERGEGNPQISLNVLEFFSRTENWKDARLAAEKLKNLNTDSPEMKLSIARALKKGGNEPAARILIEEAKTLMAAKPESKAALEKAFGDIL